MSWFAIKQKSTGFFIPQFGKNQSKGGTWLEPTDKQPPRLFRRRQDAKSALDHWLKGRLRRVYHVPEGPNFIDEGDYSDEYIPQAHRFPEDMAIVEVTIGERLCS
jgi:hypothetical protein